MLEILFTAISLTAGSLAAVIYLPKFPKWMRSIRLSLNESGRQRLIRAIENRDRHFDKAVQQPQVGNFYAIGASWGVLRVNEVSAQVVDDMHQKLRNSFNLRPLSLRDPLGLLNVDKVNLSYHQIRDEIDDQYHTGRTRELSKFALWCIVVAACAGMMAVIV